MKIIAVTTSGFLCEISSGEISKLGITSPGIGKEIPIDRLFNTLKNLESISENNLAKLKYLANDLNNRLAEIEETYEKTILMHNIKGEI